MVYIILSHILWLLYSILESVAEANDKHHKSLSKSVVEIKTDSVHNLQRYLFLIIIFSNIIGHVSFISAVSTIFSMLLIFPYVNNKIYFLMRVRLNPSFFDKNDNYEEMMELSDRPAVYFDSKIRARLALAGLAVQFLFLFI